MAESFTFQDPGEGIYEAEIKEVHVSPGDTVAEGDVLLSIETDKAVNDVEAPFTGTVDEVRVQAGDSIRVGDVLLTYRGDGEQSESEEMESESKKTARSKKKAAKKDTGPEKEKACGEESKKAKKQKQSAKAERDRDEGEHEDAGGKKSDGGESEREEAETPVPASPATRRLARELGVDLRDVQREADERVKKKDVRAFAEGGDGSAAQRDDDQPARLPDFSQWGPVERHPLRSIRRATAKQMSLAWSRIPHVMHADTADITDLEQFRREHKDAIKRDGGDLTLSVLILKALVAALKKYPDFNASLDEQAGEIIRKQYHHIGVAVATDAGLLVPVVRDVDSKSLAELAVEVSQLAERARQGELQPEEMQGGSFTLTNPGGIGGDSFTPIINYPEAAILGVGAARLEPVVRGDLERHDIVPRLRLPLCLVYDHRLNDGADAARFLRTLIDTLNDPETLLLSA